MHHRILYRPAKGNSSDFNEAGEQREQQLLDKCLCRTALHLQTTLFPLNGFPAQISRK